MQNLIIRISFLVFFLMVLMGGSVYAQDDASEKIRTLVYGENEIYELKTVYGYQSNIEFSNDEKILTLSIGDPVAFRVTPAGNRLFVKSLQDNRHTNMTVVTDKRAYQFELSSIVEDYEELVYVVRFFYPDARASRRQAGDTNALRLPNTPMQPVAVQNTPSYSPRGSVMPTPVAPAALSDVPLREYGSNQASGPGKFNFSYSISGPERLAPLKVFDDGRSTFLKLNPSVVGLMPMFHSVTPDGGEVPVSPRMEGEYSVIDTVGRIFSLRYGNEVICIYNDSSMSAAPQYIAR